MIQATKLCASYAVILMRQVKQVKVRRIPYSSTRTAMLIIPALYFFSVHFTRRSVEEIKERSKYLRICTRIYIIIVRIESSTLNIPAE